MEYIKATGNMFQLRVLCTTAAEQWKVMLQIDSLQAIQPHHADACEECITVWQFSHMDMRGARNFVTRDVSLKPLLWRPRGRAFADGYCFRTNDDYAGGTAEGRDVRQLIYG